MLSLLSAPTRPRAPARQSLSTPRREGRRAGRRVGTPLLTVARRTDVVGAVIARVVGAIAAARERRAGSRGVGQRAQEAIEEEHLAHAGSATLRVSRSSARPGRAHQAACCGARVPPAAHPHCRRLPGARLSILLHSAPPSPPTQASPLSSAAGLPCLLRLGPPRKVLGDSHRKHSRISFLPRTFGPCRSTVVWVGELTPLPRKRRSRCRGPDDRGAQSAVDCPGPCAVEGSDPAGGRLRPRRRGRSLL